MKQQILFIHGADTFSDYGDYLSFLKSFPVENPFEEGGEQRRWKYEMQKELENSHVFAFLAMPNRFNAVYKEWKVWFEKYFEFMREGIVLTGHSQGGYFLAKYLSENQLPVSISGLFLVAAPFEEGVYEGAVSGGGFGFDPKDLKKLEGQVENIFIYHSKDDPIVPFSHGEKYAKALPRAEFVTFTDRGHFICEEFPEIVESLRSLAI